MDIQERLGKVSIKMGSRVEYKQWSTPFAVHYEKIRNHLRETAINSANIHSLARKYEHLRINQIQ